MGILNRKKKNDAVAEGAVEEAKNPVAAEKSAEKKAKPAKKKAGERSAESLHKAHQTLLGPIVTEKTAQQSDNNVFVFRVATTANRIEVAHAVKAIYDVTPVKVNIMNRRGKRVRFGRTFGKRRDWKKAMVTLPKGKRIDIFEGV